MNAGQRNALLTAAHARLDRANGRYKFDDLGPSERHALLLSARYYMRQALGLEGYERFGAAR
jgi:hypothetical protein